MYELARHGRNWALRIFASAALMSLYIIVTYNLVVDDVPPGKMIQQGVRFVLTLLLMYHAFNGRRWAVILISFLFGISAAASLYKLFSELPFWGKVPFAAMSLIYSVAVYHLNFSESFREYQRHMAKVR